MFQEAENYRSLCFSGFRKPRFTQLLRLTIESHESAPYRR